jgi:hypothetical protein
MDKEKAINIAIGCVMASEIDINTAREVIDVLRELETEDSKLDEIIDYFELREGHDMNEVITDIVYETDLIKVGDESIEADECSIEWGDDYCCTLQEFIDKYTDNLLEKVVNVVKSYKEEDK